MSGILERPPAPARRRLDVEALYRMAEAGILTDPHRVELIDGEIIDMAAIGSPHAAITNRLARHFSRALPDDVALVSVQSPLRLGAYDEPEPDLMVLRPRADGFRASHPGADDVLLLVEVADSSLAYDRGVKLPLYARFGVPEVWIVDLVGGAVEVFGEAKHGGYAAQKRLTGGLLTPARRPGVVVDISALLA
ncbi:Uma2 family endonuclease [Roseiarcus fermentans]|uniref:Uma2 family endonuclease n=1 Tax=Roseiarcus fermentans TaxID=1473586 RepID=A0A366ERY6_9HYPH|nr:Uma2 family endonuclease [Roseiarcus fermentans]RBP05173.1 Uma2 family endonuclease [Roseiarcus fermentans]